MRNLLATLLLSQGTPMLVAGDEFAHTQGGNNNAYCQGNPISWLNWNIEEDGRQLTNFVQRLTKLRHTYPILRRNLFLTGEYNEELGVKDVTWINANGLEMEDRQWGDSGMRCFGMLLDGRAQTTGVKQRGHEATLLLVINDHTDLVEFTLPECLGGDTWELLIDTNMLDNSEKGTFKCQQKYGVTGHSFLVFVFNADNK